MDGIIGAFQTRTNALMQTTQSPFQPGPRAMPTPSLFGGTGSWGGGSPFPMQGVPRVNPVTSHEVQSDQGRYIIAPDDDFVAERGDAYPALEPGDLLFVQRIGDRQLPTFVHVRTIAQLNRLIRNLTTGVMNTGNGTQTHMRVERFRGLLERVPEKLLEEYDSAIQNQRVARFERDYPDNGKPTLQELQVNSKHFLPWLIRNRKRMVCQKIRKSTRLRLSGSVTCGHSWG